MGLVKITLINIYNIICIIHFALHYACMLIMVMVLDYYFSFLLTLNLEIEINVTTVYCYCFEIII